MTFNRVYNYKVDNLISLLLPTFLRKIKTYSWLKALATPYIGLKSNFEKYRSDTLYKIDHTPQVFSIENLLNDFFDPVGRRIYITDGLSYDPTRLYNIDEQKPVYLYDIEENKPVYLFDIDDIEKLDVDFIVNLPNSLNITGSQLVKFNSLVDFYSLPDKTYSINYE